MAASNPVRHYVPGAPFQVGDRVRILQACDECGYPDLAGRYAVVAYLEYECGCGQAFPDLPMLGVEGPGIPLNVELWPCELEHHAL